ncbi:MAG: hypothetical protein HC913_10770 [Microscillaceae bacterium]|nr:hypothetical protein [Microscillaceae bacterium]
MENITFPGSGNPQRLIVFTLHGQVFGLPITEVKEVVALPVLTPVPLAPAYVAGLANIRGEVLAILRPEVLLQISDDAPLSMARFVLVLNPPTLRSGLWLPDIPDTITVYENQLDRQADLSFLDAQVQTHIKALVKRDQQLILLLSGPGLVPRHSPTSLNTAS